jgi:hypothetical protein
MRAKSSHLRFGNKNTGVDPRHLKWVVQYRTINQHSLLQLYKLGKTQEASIVSDSAHRSVFALLVGAGFSLWRAVTLSDVRRTWPEIVGDANKLLLRLVQDNAVGYPQDRDTREWMGGYYLNNAKWRLIRARDELSKTNQVKKSRLKQLKLLEKINTEQQSATESCGKLNRALSDLIPIIRDLVASSNRVK